MAINFRVYCNRQCIVISNVNMIWLYIQDPFQAQIHIPLLTPVKWPEFNQTKIWPLPDTWLRQQDPRLFPDCHFQYGKWCPGQALSPPCCCASCVQQGTATSLPSTAPCVQGELVCSPVTKAAPCPRNTKDWNRQWHRTPQVEAPAPKEQPSCTQGVCQGIGLRTLHSLRIHTRQSLRSSYPLAERSCEHFKYCCCLQHSWTASQDGSETHLLCASFSALRIASGLHTCFFPINILPPGKPSCLGFFTITVLFYYHVEQKYIVTETYFRWSQQYKYDWFRKAMQGILVQCFAGWYKCALSVVCIFYAFKKPLHIKISQCKHIKH